MKINVLKSEVYNQIAAGEVVEKPFNVVKELVENSIDAGADEIKIEIEEGGVKLIKITDNGCGIERSEIPNAFAIHATSKITSIEDLQKILTLGFRGEALASISSVSKVNLKTKTKEENFGTEAICLNGNITSLSDVGIGTGSVFEITDLFYNVPARRKFLKKQSLEEADITDYVEKLILSHPHINFTYVLNGKTVYSFRSSDLENAIFTVYGKEIHAGIVEVSKALETNEKTKIWGYVGKPAIAKGTKKNQTIFINGRYIKNQTIYSAVMRAFEPYLMKGKYPFYVLNLTIPADKIDVNVHPTKQEIRFENTSEIFSFVYKAVSEAMLRATRYNSPLPLENAFEEKHKVEESEKEKTVIEMPNQKEEIILPSISLNTKPKTFSLFNDEVVVSAPTSLLDEIIIEKEINKSLNNSIIKNIEESRHIRPKMVEYTDEIKVIGTIFKTYIVAEEGERVHFIDQHAGHERLLYDKLTALANDSQEQPKQQLLLPYIKNCTPAEDAIMQASLEGLKALGLEFEPFGKNTYALNEIPMLLESINLDDFLENLFENSDVVLNQKSSDLIKNKLASYACKSAVKAGNTLTQDEIKILIARIKESGAVLLCPHGRPIIITYNKKDLEKWFKRIV